MTSSATQTEGRGAATLWVAAHVELLMGAVLWIYGALRNRFVG